VNAQNTANHVLVNFNPESQSDLLSDARTAPTRIPAFRLHHGIDEFFGRADAGAEAKTAPDSLSI